MFTPPSYDMRCQKAHAAIPATPGLSGLEQMEISSNIQEAVKLNTSNQVCICLHVHVHTHARACVCVCVRVRVRVRVMQLVTFNIISVIS